MSSMRSSRPLPGVLFRFVFASGFFISSLARCQQRRLSFFSLDRIPVRDINRPSVALYYYIVRDQSCRASGSFCQVFVVLAILAALLPLPASQAGESRGNGPSAPGFIAASGPWVDCNIVTDFKQVGPNLIIAVDITETFSGTLDGCYTGTERRSEEHTSELQS